LPDEAFLRTDLRVVRKISTRSKVGNLKKVAEKMLEWKLDEG
jgi:hypothetical protein